MCMFFFNNYRWYDEEKDYSRVVDWAYELDERYPDARLVAVGQSAAWMVDLAGYIRERAGRPANTQIIPFSGNFMDRGYDASRRWPDTGWLPEFTPSGNKPWPKPAAIRHYFNHLAGLGAAPADIAANSEKGAKTVFVDMGETSKGIASFAALYLQEARRQGRSLDLGRDVSFFVYDPHDTLNDPAVRLTDSEGTVYDLPVTARKMTQGEKFVMKLVASGNDLTSSNSRLAPYFNLTEADPQPRDCDNAALQERIRATLRAAVDRRAAAAERIRNAPAPSA